MNNLKIRNEAKSKKIQLWKIAHELGVTDSTFSKMLRFELPKEETEKILVIIDELSKDRK